MNIIVSREYTHNINFKFKILELILILNKYNTTSMDMVQIILNKSFDEKMLH